MFQKINELLAFFGHDGATFALIRNMLREKLIPLGFREDKIKGLGYGAKYIRDSFLVELYLTTASRNIPSLLPVMFKT